MIDGFTDIPLHRVADRRMGMLADLDNYGHEVAAALGRREQIAPEDLPTWPIRLADEVRASALWWVSREMCSVLDAAAPNMPRQVLMPEDVPDPVGVVFFESPLLSTVSDVRTSAISWAPAAASDTGQHILKIVTWCIIRAGDKVVTAPTGWCSWALGADQYERVLPETPDDVAADHAEDRCRLAALWTLSAQESVVDKTTQGVDKRTARRALRRGIDPSPMRVVRLRRASGEGKPGTTHGGYSHRWLVSGHWRNQWLPSRNTHRLQWIAPHVKGPEGAPLVDKVTVKAWVK